MNVKYPEAFINPDVLTWVRTEGGYSAEEMARKAGTKATRYQAWEAGKRRPSLKNVFELAHACRRPVSIFYLHVPPPREAALPDFRRLPGIASVPLSAEARLAIRLARERREAYIDLLRQLSEPSSPATWDFVGSATRRTTVSDLAKTARRQLGISLETQLGWKTEYQALNGWREALETAGVLVFQAPFDVEEMRAAAIVEKPFPTLLLSSKDLPLARVFSMMHELGHVYLGESNISGIWNRQDASETYCNRFAAELLMPREAFQRDAQELGLSRGTATVDDLRPLAQRYHVSLYAAAVRLCDLGLQSNELLRKMKPLQRERREKTGEAKEGGPSYYVTRASQLGAPLIQAAIRALSSDTITMSDASRILGVKPQHIEPLGEQLWGRA